MEWVALLLFVAVIFVLLAGFPVADRKSVV